MPVLAVAPDQPSILFVARGCGSATLQCRPGNFDGGAAIDQFMFQYQFADRNFNDVVQQEVLNFDDIANQNAF